MNMKRLTVIQDRLCYALFYVLYLCTLYKKQAGRGCFFNTTRYIIVDSGHHNTYLSGNQTNFFSGAFRIQF